MIVVQWTATQAEQVNETTEKTTEVEAEKKEEKKLYEEVVIAPLKTRRRGRNGLLRQSGKIKGNTANMFSSSR